MRIFFHLFEFAINNAHILYQHNCKKVGLPQKDIKDLLAFRLELVFTCVITVDWKACYVHVLQSTVNLIANNFSCKKYPLYSILIIMMTHELGLNVNINYYYLLFHLTVLDSRGKIEAVFLIGSNTSSMKPRPLLLTRVLYHNVSVNIIINQIYTILDSNCSVCVLYYNNISDYC